MIVFIVIGVIFAVIGVIIMLTTHGKKVRCTSVTNAKVIDIIKNITKDYSSHKNNTKKFYPLLEYTINETKYVRKTSLGSSLPKYEIGEEIEIHYNASNPNEFYTGKGNISMMLGMIFTIFGMLFIAIYLVMQMV